MDFIDDGECEHGGDPMTCPPCVRVRLKMTPAIDPNKTSYLFAARYDGQCPVCNLPIAVGEWCAMKQSGKTVHYACG